MRQAAASCGCALLTCFTDRGRLSRLFEIQLSAAQRGGNEPVAAPKRKKVDKAALRVRG